MVNKYLLIFNKKCQDIVNVLTKISYFVSTFKIIFLVVKVKSV